MARTKIGNAKPISGASVRRAEDLIETIARHFPRIREEFYDIGMALRELMDKELYRALGYASFEEMLAKRNVLGKTQAYKLLAVVRNLPRKEALGVGQEKAYALTALAKATPSMDTACALLSKGITLGTKAKDVSKLSRREIEALTKEVRRPRKQAPEVKAASQTAKVAQSALRARKIKATVETKRQEGHWWAIVRVPLENLTALIGEG